MATVKALSNSATTRNIRPAPARPLIPMLCTKLSGEKARISLSDQPGRCSGLAWARAWRSVLRCWLKALLEQVLPDEPWRPAVASIGYTVGFLIVILGRMQLFTENTLSAALPVATKPTLHNLAAHSAIVVNRVLGQYHWYVPDCRADQRARAGLCRSSARHAGSVTQDTGA